MGKVAFHKVGEPYGISSSPHWQYRSVPAGAESGAYYPAADYEALERRLEEAEQHNREWIDRCRRFREQDAEEAQRRLAEVEAQLAVADKGLLKASDPNSGWQGINKECKLWQERAEKAEAENKRLRDFLELPSISARELAEFKAALRREE